MKRKLVPLALMAVLAALPSLDALWSPPAPGTFPTPEPMVAPAFAEPLMSVDGVGALAFVEQGWCGNRVCFEYCGPEGGFYIGGSGVPCRCC